MDKPCIVQHRAHSGADWGEPKNFPNKEAARPYIRKLLRNARADFELHLLPLHDVVMMEAEAA